MKTSILTFSAVRAAFIILMFIVLQLPVGGITKCSAQTDTVSLTAGYAQQVWYSLQTGKKTSSPANNWDLAFTARYRDAAIFINPVNNLHLYLTKTTPANWSIVDTAGIFSNEQFNADTSWYFGAFNRTGDNYFNYGWGGYNQATHNVSANSVYVIKLSDGSLKKFIMDKLVYDTVYNFRYANLDGTNAQNISFNKSSFAGKAFGYFSFLTNSAVDREPKLTDWDLTFLRYNGLTPDQNGVLQNYLLTGVLQHPDAVVAKVVQKDTGNISLAGVSFSTKINTIGYDWKSYNMAANKYKIADSTAYFVKRADGKIYKIVFKGFGGSADGNIIFSHQYLLPSSTVEIDNGKSVRLTISPNPVSTNEVQLVIDGETEINNVELRIFSIVGQQMATQKINLLQGLQVIGLPIDNFSNGFYFAQLQLGNKTLTEKFVVQK